MARLVAVLALAMSLTACGAGADDASDTGHLTVIHEDHMQGVYLEGALVLVTVRTQGGASAYEGVVRYAVPSLRPNGESTRYHLVRAAELPAERLTIRAELRVCVGSCAGPGEDPTTLNRDELPRLGSRRNVCEAEIDLVAGEHRHVVLVNAGTEFAECELSNPRASEAAPGREG